MSGPKRPVVITIDGPAGSGKSTVAARLADRLGLACLDSGAMYRAVTLAAIEQAVAMDDPEALTELAARCRIAFSRRDGRNCVSLDDRDVTRQIRSQRVTDLAHKIAQVTSVRRILGSQQKAIAQQAGAIVTEGRDQGSAVFPDATVKFYLDADPAARAHRRWLQLSSQGAEHDCKDILAAQTARDERDKHRKVGPMKVPDGAIVVDTTDMTIEQVVDRMYERAKAAMNEQTGVTGSDD